jgi:hypothetical protein
MTAGELATCRVPEDLASLAPVGRYVVACTAFYEQGFSASSHRFLCSLPQFYGLELHHLSPSVILHMMTFMALGKAYMGIEPHFDLWNYFFRARLRQGSYVKVIVSSCVNLFV